MIDVKITKREFIVAYQWAYGTTKREAECIWNAATDEYKLLIIEGFRNNCKISFYN